MNGFTKKDVAEHIGRSEDYAARRFRLDAGRAFGLEEAYKILELAGLPKEDILNIFLPVEKLRRSLCLARGWSNERRRWHEFSGGIEYACGALADGGI